LFCDAWVEARVVSPLAGFFRRAWVTRTIFVAVAGGVVLVTQFYAAYEVRVWAPLGIVLVSAAGALLVGGRRPSAAIVAGAAALILLGSWSLASTAWGGLPHQAWLTFDQSVLGASALLTGSLLTAGPGRRQLIASAVLAGITVHAATVLVRLSVPTHPDDWLHGRFLQGPVGYHNAEAVLLALAVPLALSLADHERLGARLLGGASSAVLVAALLLTQSRGALVALAAGVAIQLTWARRVTLLLPVVALAGAVAGLYFALREVDAALLAGSSAEQVEAFRRYGLWTAAAALGLAAATLAARSRVVTQATAFGIVGVLLAVLVAVGVQSGGRLSDTSLTLPALPADETSPNLAPAGATRIRSLSPNGRADAWRVAKAMAAERPLIGAGQGRFARQWTKERRLSNLYILQPHSLELELASELGAVGLALFAAFLGCVVLALARTSRRGTAAAAIGAGSVLLVEASLDWTWSFPGIVAPVLLVLGAAAGSRAPRPSGWLATTGILAATFALALALVVPYLADRRLERANDLIASGAGGASGEVEAARKLAPWHAEAISLEGRLAEGAGEFDVAAERYRAAADVSQRPWANHFLEARALAAAGRSATAWTACKRAIAANPGERTLYEGACRYEQAGNRWPVVEIAARPAQPRAQRPFSAFLVDEACTACSLGFAGRALLVTVPGGADSRDTAYALLELRSPKAGQMLRVRDTLRLPADQDPEGHLAVLQVRDARDDLVYELFVHRQDGTIRLYSPAQGLGAKEFNRSTGIKLAPGGTPRVVEVGSLQDHSVWVRVDGVERLALRLRGARTGPQRFVRVGLISRSGSTTFNDARVAHSGLAARFGSPE
jgi:tetratricopeptide (TPR) repeat protein